MSFVKVKRTRIESNEPSITVTDGRFTYNTVIARLAEFSKNKYVTYYADDENRKIGFQFKLKEEDQDCYPITSKISKGWRSTNYELIKNYLWVKKITELKDSNQRRFVAIKEQNMWVIQLIPAFEYRVKIEDKRQIPIEASGIYQYKDKEGEIIYIGKGNILERLNLPERKDWGIEIIEYSNVVDDRQYEWENYWLEKYKERNNNRLPYYNKVSGVKSNQG